MTALYFGAFQVFLCDSGHRFCGMELESSSSRAAILLSVISCSPLITVVVKSRLAHTTRKLQLSLNFRI